MKYFVKEGERYNRLEILATHQRVEGKQVFYNFCRCDCGNTTYRTSAELVRGLKTSCGCAYRERQKIGNFIHGGTVRKKGEIRLPYLYGFWLRKRNRMEVLLAEEWRRDYPAFRDWVEEHLGPRPALGYRLERWEKERGFVPGNLLWVTEAQQHDLRNGFSLLAFPALPNSHAAQPSPVVTR